MVFISFFLFFLCFLWRLIYSSLLLFEKFWEKTTKIIKKSKDSTNYKKQKIKVSKIHEKIKNQRDDFLHIGVTQLVGSFFRRL
ncbi:MAG: transposase [Candidatus Wukongarchaeota archaeon]